MKKRLFADKNTKKNKWLIALKIFGLLLFAFLLTVNADWFKPAINQQLEEQKVTIGQLDYSFLSPNQAFASDITIKQSGADIKVKHVALDIDFWSLFKGEVIVNRLDIIEPVIVLTTPTEEATQKPVETQTDKPKESTGGALPISTLFAYQINVNDLTIESEIPEQSLQVSNTNITIKDLMLVKDGKLNVTDLVVKLDINNQGFSTDKLSIAAINFGTQFGFGSVNFKNITSALPTGKYALDIDNITFDQQDFGSLTSEFITTAQQLKIDSLVIDIKPTKLNLTGNIQLPVEEPTIQLQISDSQVQFEQFSHFYQESDIKPYGLMSINADVQTTGAVIDPNSFFNNLTGTLTTNLQPGKIEGLDINAALGALKESQETSLLDIGGYLLTGPIGLIAGQLFDLTGGLSALGGETQIEHLSLLTKFDQGLVDVTDTAIATDEFRLALKGKLAPLPQEFVEFEFALLDAQGCADLSQSLNGPMSDPTSAVANNLLATVMSPVNELSSGVTDAIAGCDVFYQGIVKQPAGK